MRRTDWFPSGGNGAVTVAQLWKVWGLGRPTALVPPAPAVLTIVGAGTGRVCGKGVRAGSIRFFRERDLSSRAAPDQALCQQPHSYSSGSSDRPMRLCYDPLQAQRALVTCPKSHSCEQRQGNLAQTPCVLPQRPHPPWRPPNVPTKQGPNPRCLHTSTQPPALHSLPP